MPVSPSGGPVKDQSPIHTRALDLDDIRNIRRWHKAAVLRAKKAGFDIIYCYGRSQSFHRHALPVARNEYAHRRIWRFLAKPGAVSARTVGGRS
ncbi:MAG: hypothetical protein WDN06_12095 [Asticcacaulis sp.]